MTNHSPSSGPNKIETPAQERRRYSIEHQLDQILTELKLHRGAFPEDEFGNPDIDGHRRYHEAKIQAAKAEAEFWRELRLDVAKKGTWAVITILAGLLMLGLASKLGFGGPR